MAHKPANQNAAIAAVPICNIKKDV